MGRRGLVQKWGFIQRSVSLLGALFAIGLSSNARAFSMIEVGVGPEFRLSGPRAWIEVSFEGHQVEPKRRYVVVESNFQVSRDSNGTMVLDRVDLNLVPMQFTSGDQQRPWETVNLLPMTYRRDLELGLSGRFTIRAIGLEMHPSRYISETMPPESVLPFFDASVSVLGMAMTHHSLLSQQNGFTVLDGSIQAGLSWKPDAENEFRWTGIGGRIDLQLDGQINDAYTRLAWVSRQWIEAGIQAGDRAFVSNQDQSLSYRYLKTDLEFRF